MDAPRRLAPAAQPPGGHGLVLRVQHQGAGVDQLSGIRTTPR
jgi:hypothetical protein